MSLVEDRNQCNSCILSSNKYLLNASALPLTSRNNVVKKTEVDNVLMEFMKKGRKKMLEKSTCNSRTSAVCPQSKASLEGQERALRQNDYLSRGEGSTF